MRLTWLASILLAGHCAAWAAPTYTVREVFVFDRPFDGSVYSSANAISGNGWVAANRGQVGAGALAFRCKDRCEQVPLLPGGHHGTVSANAISNDGVIVGSRPMGPPYDRAYKWDGVTLTELEPFTDECPGCFLSSGARAIDKAGNVGGSADGVDRLKFAVRFGADGSRQKLPTLGGTWAEITAMTHDGFMAGTAARPDGSWRAFVFADGDTELTELGTLGGASSEVAAVNAHRQVVGCAQREGDGQWQGFIHDGSMAAIPTLTGGSACARGINRHGQVVGYESVGLGESVGTLYVRGRVFDLNERLADADRATWTITFAAGINGKGQIAASARNTSTGVRRAVVLEPQPR